MQEAHPFKVPPIRKAVIPVAGLGTRLRPLSYVVPKAMMPLVDARGRVLPVLHFILAEAAAAGAEQAAIVVSPGQDLPLRKYLAAARDMGFDDLPAQIEFITQSQPLGFGHAVLQAKDFVAGGPFMLLLGDHVYQYDPAGLSCAAQVAKAFAAVEARAMIGMQPVGLDELPKVGVARGLPLAGGSGGPVMGQLGGGRLYRCDDFVEKPDLATARRRLATAGLEEDQFLAHCGVFVFTAEIMDCLAALAASERKPGQEIQLADAQSILLSRHRDDYYLYRIAGRALDTGTPAGYAATVAAFGHS